MRTCISCHRYNVESSDGIAICRECRDEKRREKNRRFRRNHLSYNSMSKERTRKWRNSENGKKYEHSVRYKESQTKYLATLKGKAMIARRDARRRAKLKLHESNLTADEWNNVLDRHGRKCFYCSAQGKLTIDHVTPLSLGGKHVKENVVPACRSCNSKKGSREVITDGYQIWPKKCAMCGNDSMQVVRPGKVQCCFCG